MMTTKIAYDLASKLESSHVSLFTHIIVEADTWSAKYDKNSETTIEALCCATQLVVTPEYRISDFPVTWLITQV